MNALLRYVLRNLARRRTRTVVGILGIFLTIALLTAIQIGLDSLSVSYTELVSLQAGKADVLIRARDSDLFNPGAFDPREAWAKLETNAAIAGASPRIIGRVRVRGADGEFPALLIGVDPAREKQFDLWGLKPEPALAEGTIALSKGLAARSKSAPGARISLQTEEGFATLELTVEGILDRQLFLPQEIQDFAVVNLPHARELLGEPDRVHLLAAAIRNPRDYYDPRDLMESVRRLRTAGDQLAASLGGAFQVTLPKAQAMVGFRDFASPLRAVFGVFALLTLLITGLLIYSLISVAVEERVREYAILRTLGARKRSVFGLVIAESLALCSLGVLPGVFAGVAVAKAFVGLLGLVLGAREGLPVEVTGATLGFTLAGGILMAVGSALAPAWRTSRWNVVDALDPLRRGQLQGPAEAEASPSKAPLLTGVLLTSVSGVVFFVLPAAVLSGNPSLIGSVILSLLIAILLGLTLMALGLLPGFQRLLFGLLRPWFGMASGLAARNLDRHRRRHTTTALLFTLSVSLVVFVASLVALASRVALDLVAQAHGADIRINAWDGPDDSVRREMAAIAGVRGVSEARFLRARSQYGTAYDVVIRDLVGLKDLWVVPFGIDAELPGILFTDAIVWHGGAPDTLREVAEANRLGEGETEAPVPVILSLAIARHLDVRVGDWVELSFRLGSYRKEGRFRVAGICSALPGFQNFRGRVASAVGAGLLLPLSAFREMTASAPAEAFHSVYWIQSEPGSAAQKRVAERLREQFDVRYRFGVQSTAEQQEQARVLYWATQVFFGLLLAVAIVIAVFSLIASMASAVLERRREIGVLKALGMRRSLLFRLFLAEGVVLTLSAGVAGGGIGFLLAWLFVFQASLLMEFAAVFTLPYLTLAATLVISVLAGILAARIPTGRLLRQSAAEILRV